MTARWRRDQATQPTATERFAPHKGWKCGFVPDNMAEMRSRVNAKPSNCT